MTCFGFKVSGVTLVGSQDARKHANRSRKCYEYVSTDLRIMPLKLQKRREVKRQGGGGGGGGGGLDKLLLVQSLPLKRSTCLFKTHRKFTYQVRQKKL